MTPAGSRGRRSPEPQAPPHRPQLRQLGSFPFIPAIHRLPALSFVRRGLLWMLTPKAPRELAGGANEQSDSSAPARDGLLCW